MLHLLKKYSPKHDKYVTLKNNLIDNVSKFYEGREKIIEGFKNEVFPFYYDKHYKKQLKVDSEIEEEQEQTKTDRTEIFRYIVKEERSLNNELFKKHVNLQRPSDTLMCLNKAKDKTKTMN